MKNKKYSYFFHEISDPSYLEISSEIKLGFEKESLRVSNFKISTESHPNSLGSSLRNSFITTDFSEAQLELITPPMLGNHESKKFLDAVHHFVHKNINHEILWPLSMPPHINSEKEIPVARFGTSHEGFFKHIYRVGLENRYGKMMQSISGFHFNYSLPEKFWINISESIALDASKLRSMVYFNILRNI